MPEEVKPTDAYAPPEPGSPLAFGSPLSWVLGCADEILRHRISRAQDWTMPSPAEPKGRPMLGVSHQAIAQRELVGVGTSQAVAAELAASAGMTLSERLHHAAHTDLDGCGLNGYVAKCFLEAGSAG